MFAFCPLTNMSMCGISSLGSNRDMKLIATFEEQYIETNNLRYNEEIPSALLLNQDDYVVSRYDACYYEIEASIS